MLRRALAGLGLLIAAFGALFLLQGLGIVRWPASSFMIGRQTASVYATSKSIVQTFETATNITF